MSRHVWAQDGTSSSALRDDNRYEGRLVTEVRITGLDRVSRRFVENNIRTGVGRPLSWDTVRADLRRLERLGEFNKVEAVAEQAADRSVVVIFELQEAPIVRDIAWVGNKELNDDDIAEAVSRTGFISGVPIDDFRIRQTKRAIEAAYREKGFFSVEVTIDNTELDTDQTIIFRIREGERTQVTAIRFRGNDSIQAKQLRPVIETKKRVLFFNAPLDSEVLDRDISTLIDFYQDRGFLDVRADRRIQISPNGKEAIVTFLIEEGPLYTLRSILIEGSVASGGELRVFSPKQLRGLIAFKPGAEYRRTSVDAATRTIEEAYQKLGYVDVRTGTRPLITWETSEVDLVIQILEGDRFRTGLVSIIGNQLTKHKIIRRETDIRPGHWLDATEISETERRLAESGLFERSPLRGGRPPRVTVQPENPENPGYRDVLIEVQETNTGSLAFGAAIDSDAGVVGQISLTQRNFDVADVPDSFDELFKGRAFRGAGQNFSLVLAPGVDVSTYSIGLTEPSFLESEYALGGTVFFRQRDFDDYDEERFGGNVRLTRNFGTRWSGSVRVRAESVDISNIRPSSPEDLFEVQGQNALTALGFDLRRATVDSALRPTRGTVTDIVVEQYGALGGDYQFTRLQVDHSAFLTVGRDDFDRPTVLKLDLRGGWIPQEDESPIFERFFLGGRSFRGFDFRGIGPVGIRNDTGQPGNEKVGGDFLFFAGAEVEQPIWGDLFSGVVFVDSGILAEKIEFSPYRVSVGFGARLYLPQFGQAPLAFDFGFPILKEETDDTRLFSFSVDVPF
ncbi:MAG: outer membrane protein assembly factor BamA [Planctomycetota bacterium]